MDSLLHCSRLVPDSGFNHRFLQQKGSVREADMVPLQGQPLVGIGFDQVSLLSSMYFQGDTTFLAPLDDEQVEVEVRTVGLNTKDLAVASERFDWNKHSTECSGPVSKLMLEMNPSDKFEEVASMPVVYMTAIYAFQQLAHLKKVKSVLIQSATGRLATAAMRLAKHIGADIYATIGNAEKNNVLVNEFGIGKHDVFSFRELSTPSKILAATNGNGPSHQWAVSSRSDEPDILRYGKLGLDVFKRNATFSSFDLGLMNQQRSAFVAGLVAELGDLYRKGVMWSIDHLTTVDLSQLEQAFMYFAKATHLGKVVVTFQDPKAMVELRPSPKPVTLDTNAVYLPAGCLGGLGRSISAWIAERGAKNVIYLSRSGYVNAQAKSMLEHVHSAGVATQIIGYNLTQETDVNAAIS
ncbi:MAG: hypothetical protein Q9184_005697 [Pyrenodesmia sp. 2 TL-2023]